MGDCSQTQGFQSVHINNLTVEKHEQQSWVTRSIQGKTVRNKPTLSGNTNNLLFLLLRLCQWTQQVRLAVRPQIFFPRQWENSGINDENCSERMPKCVHWQLGDQSRPSQRRNKLHSNHFKWATSQFSAFFYQHSAFILTMEPPEIRHKSFGFCHQGHWNLSDTSPRLQTTSPRSLFHCLTESFHLLSNMWKVQPSISFTTLALF